MFFFLDVLTTTSFHWIFWQWLCWSTGFFLADILRTVLENIYCPPLYLHVLYFVTQTITTIRINALRDNSPIEQPYRHCRPYSVCANNYKKLGRRAMMHQCEIRRLDASWHWQARIFHYKRVRERTSSVVSSYLSPSKTVRWNTCPKNARRVQLAQLWQRHCAKHVSFLINVQIYSLNNKIAFLSHLMGELGVKIDLSERFNAKKLCSRVLLREYQFYS